MYEELIKRLRELHPEEFGNQWDFAYACQQVMHEAADTIEELSKKRVGTWHRVKASQRSYSFVCNSCGSMYPYITRCCPNCGVEYIGEEPPKEENDV